VRTKFWDVACTPKNEVQAFLVEFYFPATMISIISSTDVDSYLLASWSSRSPTCCWLAIRMLLFDKAELRSKKLPRSAKLFHQRGGGRKVFEEPAIVVQVVDRVAFDGTIHIQLHVIVGSFR